MRMHDGQVSAWHAQLTRLFFPFASFCWPRPVSLIRAVLLRQDSPCSSIESLGGEGGMAGMGLFPKEGVR